MRKWKWVNRLLYPSSTLDNVVDDCVSVFDPYHYCEDGWFRCCQENLLRQHSDISYCSFFADQRAKYIPMTHIADFVSDTSSNHVNEISPGRYTFTYRNWLWHKEVFFEDLPRPSRLDPTACGLCYSCVSYRGKWPCFFPQPKGTYAFWLSSHTIKWCGYNKLCNPQNVKNKKANKKSYS